MCVSVRSRSESRNYVVENALALGKGENNVESLALSVWCGISVPVSYDPTDRIQNRKNGSRNGARDRERVWSQCFMG